MIDHYEESFHHRTMELPDELLKGAIDIHVHAGPHLISSPRRVDPFQAAEMARDAGLRAIVLMDVIDSSTGTAWMVSRKVAGISRFWRPYPQQQLWRHESACSKNSHVLWCWGQIC